MLDCPAGSVPQLVEWTLKESGLGTPRLDRNGKDSDPLVALTAGAAVRLGLPERLEQAAYAYTRANLTPEGASRLWTNGSGGRRGGPRSSPQTAYR
ncbi:hypothetical protein [Streptomyces sp. NPDC054849]